MQMNHAELRKAATAAQREEGDWAIRYLTLFNPSAVLALLDEIEALRLLKGALTEQDSTEVKS